MHKKAFTLIELLITITIIGILTALASVSYSGIQERGRDAQRKNDLAGVSVALSTYYSTQIPAAFPSSTSKATLNNSSDILAITMKPSIIKNIPSDPKNTTPFLYKYQSFNSGRDYKLYATLENTKDKKGWAGGSAWVADGYVIENQ